MFKNHSFYIHTSNTISSRHRVILEKLLSRHGATIVAPPCTASSQNLFNASPTKRTFFQSHRVDYIIVGDRDDLQHQLHESLRDKVRNRQWVSECVKEGEIIDFTEPQNESQTDSQQKANDQQQGNVTPQKLHLTETTDSSRKRKFKYACESPSTVSTNYSTKPSGSIDQIASYDMNSKIIAQLEQLKHYYYLLSDQWRQLTLQKAIAAIKNHPKEIHSVEDLKDIRPPLGEKTRIKVEEIIVKGKSSRLECFQNDERMKVIEEFVKIWGVGGKSASTWYDTYGLHSMEDLRDAVKSSRVKLTSQQQVGLRYYDDLQHRIPREEVKAIDEYVRTEALQINPHLRVETCGSYRRGAASSGDVDILISTTKDAPKHFPPDFLKTLVENLTKQGFITAHLSASFDHDEHHSFMGVCKHPTASAYHRRLDLKFYRPEIYAFAILYFTGSAHFNRSMRLLAHRKGLSLSDKSLRPVKRQRGEKVVEGPPIPCDTEEDIFKALELEYRSPNERNV